MCVCARLCVCVCTRLCVYVCVCGTMRCWSSTNASKICASECVSECVSECASVHVDLCMPIGACVFGAQIGEISRMTRGNIKKQFPDDGRSDAQRQLQFLSHTRSLTAGWSRMRRHDRYTEVPAFRRSISPSMRMEVDWAASRHCNEDVCVG